jgi:RNA processing factor Prp31
MTAATSTTSSALSLLGQAKQVIMTRMKEEDNVTFDELEYLLNEHKLYQEVVTEEEEKDEKKERGIKVPLY